jgi:4,4'-diaponeurosporenoate glycosyltransferase
MLTIAEAGLDGMGVSLLVRWLIGWALMARLPELPDQPVGGTPLVSVLIPARNEERTLPHLLEGLKSQTLQPAEVVVIDDHSSDATGRIAHDAGATVLSTPEPPAGWTGKNWALHTGVGGSRGEILVFLDADTEPAPDLLRRLVAAVQRQGGLVSVQPYHRTERPFERLSILFNLVGLMAVKMGPGGDVAFGPAMATSRIDYLRSGGHEAVAGHVVEDWFVAHAYQAAGLPTTAYIGHRQLSYRMYPGGIWDLVHGFDKNFATAAGQVSVLRMLAVVLWLSALFWAAWCLPATLLGLPVLGQPSLQACLVLYLAFALQLTLLVRPVGQFGLAGLLFPLPVVFFLLVFIRSILNLERGRIEWKGRQVDTHLEQR